MTTASNTKAYAALTAVLESFRNAVHEDIQANAIQVFLLVAQSGGRDGVSMQDIERHTGLSQAAVSRNVAMFTEWNRHRTEGPGLLQRTEDLMNRRQKLVKLTPKGQRFADKLADILNK